MAFGPKVTVTLERYTQTITGTGSPSNVYNPVRTLRGTLQPVRGSRAAQFDRMGITADYEFTMDKQPALSITERDRIRLGTRYFTITWKEDPMERGRYTTLFLQELKREQMES